MAVITFRKPEDGLEHYKLLIDLVTILQDVKNPEIANNVKEISKELTLAQELSEAKKKELHDAEEIIAQSGEFLEEFEKSKLDHEKKVVEDLSDIQSKKSSLDSDKAALAIEKENANKLVDKQKAEVEEKLAEATAKLDSAKTLQKETQDQLLELGNLRTEHKETAAEFEKNRDETIKDYAAKLLKYNNDIEKLAEERETFEAYKNKFYAVLKENA